MFMLGQGVCTFKVLLKKLMFTFVEYLDAPANAMISALTNPTVSYSHPV